MIESVAVALGGDHDHARLVEDIAKGGLHAIIDANEIEEVEGRGVHGIEIGDRIASEAVVETNHV